MSKWIMCLGITAIVIALALYQGLAVGRFTLYSAKLNKDTQIQLCLITDLHSITWGEKQQKLIEKIKSTQPDVILLGGDIYDDRQNDGGQAVTQLLEGIKGLAPIFYVTGSHDIWTWQMDYYEKILESYGVTVLHGETIPLTVRGQTLYISGIDEPAAAVLAGQMDEDAFYRESLQVFSGMDLDAYHLLIAHRPEYIDEYAKLGFDLVVSGHCHGGQVRIPLLLNGLFAPGQGWFPRYAAGKYVVENTTLIVSRGLYFSYHLPRIFNRPEVVHITLKGPET